MERAEVHGAASQSIKSARLLAHAPLTRRRSRDAPDECWHVYYGDVRVGTITIRTGMPPGEDPWSWACGFYPGSHPRECTDGTAPTFDETRAEYAWLIFRRGAISGIGPLRSIAASIVASACRRTGSRHVGPPVADRGWKRRFDEPIPLPRGRQPREAISNARTTRPQTPALSG